MHIFERNIQNIHTCQRYIMIKKVQSRQISINIVTFDNTPDSKILDAGNILSNLQKPWTIACKDISRVLEIEYSTYHISTLSEKGDHS